MARRHRWNKLTKFKKQCTVCEMVALQRPHPYARKWWTEWTRGGRAWNTLDGSKTPECPGHTIEEDYRSESDSVQ